MKINTFTINLFTIDSNKSNEGQVTARRVGEVVSTAFNVAASTFNYPIGKTINYMYSIAV